MTTHVTPTGIRIESAETTVSYPAARDELARALDGSPGLLLYSNYEFPGRYSRFDLAFLHPPLQLETRGRTFKMRALNERGRVLLDILTPRLAAPAGEYALERVAPDLAAGEVHRSVAELPEELRTRRLTVFAIVRRLLDVLRCGASPHLGLYGAFGYDVIFQLEEIAHWIPREPHQRDIVLYLPDELMITDHVLRRSAVTAFEFAADGLTTAGLPRTGASRPFRRAVPGPITSDHAPGQYAQIVRKAKEYFRRGDLFEVVPGQEFSTPCGSTPSQISETLRGANPCPYGFLINLNDGEYLVGASPEMFVRVTGKYVETCPISGTIARGRDALEDSRQILRLLTSQKDEAELTMCTDVDRNDKSRVCVPGTVRVIGRRQIEVYSRLIHTVDHIEGQIRDELDGVDAFLSHAWAVTVTGAPKRWALKFIEANERSPRRWYGGAVGVFHLNGNINTGLILRTVHIEHDVARIRAGATLLFDSDPDSEENETRLKASAFLDAVVDGERHAARPPAAPALPQLHKRVFFVDHEDSFVHTLTNYFSQLGADVVTYRSGFREELLASYRADLVVLSPGPGSPRDFDLARTLALCEKLDLPVFGVCLGLQGIVEYFGGRLHILDTPWHGRRSEITVHGGRLFEGIATATLSVGRYHSLHARVPEVPGVLRVTADDGHDVVMAVEHTSLPISAVQFHPESIMTADGGVGLRIIENALRGA